MPRCPWAITEPNITYHDKEWGVPVHDDRTLFSVPDSRRGTSGIELEHDPEETRKLPQGARWFSPGKDRALRRARGEAFVSRRRNRPEPVEDCGHHPECEGVSRGPERVRQLRRL